MGGQRTPWLGIAILVGAIAVAVAIPDRSLGVGADLWSLETGLLVAAVAVGISAYRRDRDPAVLFVTTGAGALAADGLLTVATALVDADGGTLVGWPSTLAARTVLAGSLVLAASSNERRDASEPLPAHVAALATIAAVALTLTLALLVPRDDPSAVADAARLTVGAALAVTGAWLAARTDMGWWSATAIAGAVAVLASSTFLGSEPGGWRLDVVRAAPVCEGAFLLAGMLGAARRRASLQLRAAARADEILAGRAEIASMLAHEVRGPVTTIKGLAATTSGSYDRLSDEERRDFVGLIEEEAARLLDVVDQTALALRLDAGTLTVQRRAEELAPIVAEAVDRTPTDPHPVVLDLAENVAANVDRRWLGNAIGQGVSNAARFSPPDAPIDVRLRVEGGDALVEISDRGPGVPEERREEVFGRFVRWRPPGYEDRQGSGLGLFICRALLAEHGGDASLGIRARGGTMLRLRLPMEG